MPLNVWTQPSGYNFGNFYGEESVEISLPVQNATGVTFEVISGSLPSGVFLVYRNSAWKLYGSPFIVKNKLNYSFCIRAKQAAQISDRTFYLNLIDRNLPTFITPPGELAAGLYRQFYVLDSTYVSYQLEAVDLNTSTEDLKFFIASGDGHLPPGLTLSDSGLIEGFVKPLIEINPNNNSDGNFDGSINDFGAVSTDGFDDYQYDVVNFDFSIPTQSFITLNANYQFRVTISDGISTTQRIFRIFVLGDDAFRADSTGRNGLAGSFTADATYIRQPFWITKSNLGIFRANNYITLPLVLYDTKLVVFRLETTNQEVYATAIQVDRTDNIVGSNTITITNVSATPVKGQYFSFQYYLENATSELYQISQVTSLGNDRYRLQLASSLLMTIPNNTIFYMGSLTKLPPGMRFDQQTGNVVGVVPYQPSVTQSYKFTITATRLGEKNDLVTNSKTFNIAIIGDVNSDIVWNSNANLGSIPANYICTLSVNAVSNIPNATIIYQLVSGNLPVGLTINPDGEIIGTPNQFFKSASNTLGLITFDNAATTFDQNTTTIDRTHKFVIKASDQYGYSAVTREFSITLTTPNSFNYSNITTKPFLDSAQRTLWKNFINNTNIFTPSSIYRANDVNFGVQTSLKMLVYAGIETKVAAAYVGAMGLNHKRKRFHFGGVKKATAVDRDTGSEIYEIVYVQMLDPLEPNGKHLPLKLVSSAEDDIISADNNSRSLSNLTIDSPITIDHGKLITADSTGYEISDPKSNNYYPNSITNWRTRIKQVGGNERNYLPLWMRSIPTGEKEEIDYTLAIPLCFCQLGTADKILLNIKFSGFDFKNIDYTVDRYIIDSVTGQDSDKYLVFRNDRITV
jgi:hypothetical protein